MTPLFFRTGRERLGSELIRIYRLSSCSCFSYKPGGTGCTSLLCAMLAFTMPQNIISLWTAVVHVLSQEQIFCFNRQQEITCLLFLLLNFKYTFSSEWNQSGCVIIIVSASRHQLIVPRHRRTKFGRQAFSVEGLTTWNLLPDCLHSPSLSEDTFRQSLNTYLFALYCVMRSINFVLTYERRRCNCLQFAYIIGR